MDPMMASPKAAEQRVKFGQEKQQSGGMKCRWDERIKQEIKSSRVETTRRIANAINAIPKNKRPKVLVSSSAVGYYGTSETGTFDERSNSGKDYLSEICREWEAAANEADTRVVIIRTGIVLSTLGGALAKMMPVFNLFGGMNPGSWHVDVMPG
jgi:uncharacterized protein